jgi:hypothetical protein
VLGGREAGESEIMLAVRRLGVRGLVGWCGAEINGAHALSQPGPVPSLSGQIPDEPAHRSTRQGAHDRSANPAAIDSRAANHRPRPPWRRLTK